MAPSPLATVTQNMTDNERSTNNVTSETTTADNPAVVTTATVTTEGVLNETTNVSETTALPAPTTTTSTLNLKISVTSSECKKISPVPGKKRTKLSPTVNIAELKMSASERPPLESTKATSSSTSIIVETNNKTLMVTSPPSPKPHKIVLKTVNPHITCNLCKGYLIDATTIVECLHSFCHSCLMKHLRTQQYCPRCEMMINKAKPNIKPDATLQAIAYKLVPGIYEKELLRKRAFYNVRPDEARLATPEQRGEDTEHLIFNPTEKISLSLEYADIEDVDERDVELSKPKYLHCPAIFKVSCLKKFILLKFGIDMTQFHVEIMYKVKTIVLPDYYTLMDVAYIYTWKRDAPMRFFYRVRTNETVSEELPEVPLCRSPNVNENSQQTTVANDSEAVIDDSLKKLTKNQIDLQEKSSSSNATPSVTKESEFIEMANKKSSILQTKESDQIKVQSANCVEIDAMSISSVASSANIVDFSVKESKGTKDRKIGQEESSSTIKDTINKFSRVKSVNDDSVLVIKNKSKQKSENRRHSMGGKNGGSIKSSDKLTKLKIKNNLQPKIENIKLKIDWSKQVSIIPSGTSCSASISTSDSIGKLSKSGKTHEEKKLKHSKKLEKLKINELQNKSSGASNIKVELIKSENQKDKIQCQQQLKVKAEKPDKEEKIKKNSNKIVEGFIKLENSDKKKDENGTICLGIPQSSLSNVISSTTSTSHSNENDTKTADKNAPISKDNIKSSEKNGMKSSTPQKTENNTNDHLSLIDTVKIKSEFSDQTDINNESKDSKCIKLEADMDSKVKTEQKLFPISESEEQKSQFLNSFELTPRKSLSPLKPKDVFLVPALPTLKKNLSPPLFAQPLMKQPNKRKNKDPIRSVLKKGRMDIKSTMDTTFFSSNSMIKYGDTKNKKPSISFDLSPYPIGSGKSESMPPPALPLPKQLSKSHEKQNKTIVGTCVESATPIINQTRISSPILSVKSTIGHAMQSNGASIYPPNGLTRDMLDKSTSLHPAIAMAKKGVSGASPIYEPQYPNFMQGASKNKYSPLISRPKTFGLPTGRILTSMKSPRYTPSSPIYSPNSPQYNNNYNIPTQTQYKYMMSPNLVTSYANLSQTATKIKSPSSKTENKRESPPAQETAAKKFDVVPSNGASQNILSTTRASPPLEPTEKQEKVQSLLSSCNINFPSSLSITLTNDQNDSNSNSFSSSRRQSPVKNYIEIVKLPDVVTASSNSSISPTLSSGIEMNSENTIIFKPEKSSPLGIEKDLLAKVNELKNKGNSSPVSNTSNIKKTKDAASSPHPIAPKKPKLDDTKSGAQPIETTKPLKQVPNLNPIEKRQNATNVNQSFAAAAATTLALLQQNEAKKETFQQQFLQSIKEKGRLYKLAQPPLTGIPIQSAKPLEKIPAPKSTVKKTSSPRVSPNSEKKPTDQLNESNSKKNPESSKSIRKSVSPKTYESAKKKKIPVKGDSALDLSATVGCSKALVPLENANPLAKIMHENNMSNLMPHPSQLSAQLLNDLMQRNAVAGATQSGQQPNPALYLPQLSYTSQYMGLYFLEHINRMQKAGSDALDNYVKKIQQNKSESTE